MEDTAFFRKTNSIIRHKLILQILWSFPNCKCKIAEIGITFYKMFKSCY